MYSSQLFVIGAVRQRAARANIYGKRHYAV